MRARTNKGFTLIELLISISIIGLLLTLAVPRYTNSMRHSKEKVLSQNLSIIRDGIGRYHSDKGRYPAELSELVDAGYLRGVPVDPITESKDSWLPIEIYEAGREGIVDVQSGALGTSAEGVPYEQL